MPILTPLRPIFDAMNAPKPQSELTVSEARAALHDMIDQSFGAFTEKHAPLPIETDHVIPVENGEIVVRVYSSSQTAGTNPCYIYMHGGGFWLGTLGQSDNTCRQLVRDIGCVVASIGYRLAPEHKFPTAAEDCYAALVWVKEHAEEIGVDPDRLAVGGGSAGGNLAAVVSLMSRDRAGPRLVLQVLEIPVTDMMRVEPLHFPEENLVVESGKEEYGCYYLQNIADAKNPYASPLRADSLDGLPPALIMTAEYDPLRPEGEAYAERLRSYGVPVEYKCWEGQFHGSQGLASLIPVEAAAYKNQIARAVRNAFAIGGPDSEF